MKHIFRGCFLTLSAGILICNSVLLINHRIWNWKFTLLPKSLLKQRGNRNLIWDEISNKTKNTKRKNNMLQLSQWQVLNYWENKAVNTLASVTLDSANIQSYWCWHCACVNRVSHLQPENRNRFENILKILFLYFIPQYIFNTLIALTIGCHFHTICFLKDTGRKTILQWIARDATHDTLHWA